MVLLQVEYAQTSFTSRLVRLHNISGEARIKQSFVFAAVRPLSSKLLQVSVWVTHHKTRVGHQIGKLTEDIVDLLRQSQRAEMEKQACLISHYIGIFLIPCAQFGDYFPVLVHLAA